MAWSEQAVLQMADLSHLALVRLDQLMSLTTGEPEIVIALIDGPIARPPALVDARVRELSGTLPTRCNVTDSVACSHGTFVAGMLCARRGASMTGICPDTTLLIRPVFSEATSNGSLPNATPEDLAAAITESIDAGARIINLSLGVAYPSPGGIRQLDSALDYALRRGVIVVAAAGNQGTMGSSNLTRHPWVIPVAACDGKGRPMRLSNFGHSIGRNGLCAPGEGVRSISATGEVATLGGTSFAVPFVTGTVALLWSKLPAKSAAELKYFTTRAHMRRRTVVPPLLDAWDAYTALASN